MVLLYFIITLLLVGSRLRFYPEMKHILYDKLTYLLTYLLYELPYLQGNVEK